MAKDLRGKPVADALSEKLTARVAELKEGGISPKLAILRVGARDDDLSYERGALKRCAAIGIEVEQVVLDAACNQDELMAAIDRINADDTIHGCLMFRPLPRTLDEAAVCNALDPAKDIDCSTERSLFGVFANRQIGFPPCTAEACIQLLDFYGYDLTGAEVTVVGRSLVIGKPVAMMLMGRHATITVCHSRTAIDDFRAAGQNADVVVSAIGRAKMIGSEILGSGQTIIDVGINVDEEGNLCGDVNFEEAESGAAAITPVPGGVGSVTTAVLMKHVVEAAQRSVQK